MKLLDKFLAVALSLPLLAVAAKPKASVFDTYRTKSLSTNPLKLSDSAFDELTTETRNYSVTVCLTAIDARFGCKLCQDFEPEWNAVASSWTRGDKKAQSRLLFGTLDFSDGKQTFQKLRLETAPILLFYPPTVGPDAKPAGEPSRFDFSNGPLSAEQVHAWLARQLPESDPKPPIYRPINWLRVIALATAVLGSITALTVAWPYVLPVLQSRNLWAAGCIIAILLFTSGHMYNHIRGVPYVATDAKGGVSYFASGFQNQFGLESQIIAAIYAVLAFATIALALKVPRMQDPTSQQAAVFIWGAIMYGIYSFLLSIFRTKNAGYPFFLPPF